MLSLAVATAGAVFVAVPDTYALTTYSVEVPVTKTLFYPALQQPVPIVAGVAETVTADKWLSVSVQPPRRKGALHSDAAFVPVVEAPAETVTLDKWWSPAAGLVKVRRAPFPAGDVGLPLVVVPSDGWLSSSVQMPRRKPQTCDSLSFVAVVAAPAETITVDMWLGQLSILAKRSSPATGTSVLVSVVDAVAPPVTPAVDIDTGWNDRDWPRRRKPQKAAAGAGSRGLARQPQSACRACAASPGRHGTVRHSAVA